MQSKSYVSTLEQKLLVGFFVFISLLFYFYIAQTKIESYNREVEIEEGLKTLSPDQRVSFGDYPVSTPFLSQVFRLDFVFIPFTIYLLIKRKFSFFVFSAIINLFTKLSFLYWIYFSYNSYLTNEVHFLHNSPYGYFGLLSNVTGFALAIASTIFVILQLAIITRFVFEKNQAKISFR